VDVQKHRLHALCPYFAMFPPTFARTHILTFTSPGAAILDPFSGRGTTLLEGLLLGRQALALDVNPVASCVTGAKARVPRLAAVRARLAYLEHELGQGDPVDLHEEAQSLPPFFSYAFHARTLRELLFLRRRLDWHNEDVDRFIAALTLGSLHGEMDKSPSYFSNQMPRTISTKPEYSIKYWHGRGLKARRRRVFTILRRRARLRLREPGPRRSGVAIQADARRAGYLLESWRGQVQAIVTSPPYLNVTNFEEDQWLRLWFLGGPPRPTYGRISRDDRYSKSESYWQFLAEAWQGIAGLMAPGGFIVCRIGGKGQDADSLARGIVATLRSALADAQLVYGPATSAPVKRQTDNFRPGTVGCGLEADFVFRL